MFDIYKKKLRAHYTILKDHCQLSENLENPNRTKLKNECLRVYRKKYNSTDDEMLRSFFDPENRYNDHIISIEKFELDKFRPLVSFIKGDGDTRDEDAIKLFAWLINFPFYREWKNKRNTIEKYNVDSSNDDVVTTDQLHQETENPLKFKNSRTNIALIFLAVLLIGKLAFYLWTIQISNVRMPDQAEKCMYWTGYHYEPVLCDEIKPGLNIIPLNIDKLKRMSKIPFFVKVTNRDVGKLWRAKIDGRIEYFTDSAMHPVETAKRLLPLSSYMVAKHETEKNLISNIVSWTYYVVVLSLVMLLIFQIKNGRSKSADHQL